MMMVPGERVKCNCGTDLCSGFLGNSAKEKAPKKAKKINKK
jgi:hypothetical protein